jgi:Tfp pilus assembly PilM family ATPase
MNRFSLPSSRRFLVMDAGSRCLKALLVSMPFGRVLVHGHRVVDLDEGNQPGSPGWTRLLQDLIDELGTHPLVVTVPQHSTDSQVLDLPTADARSIRDQIQADIVRLSGLTESAIIYDYGRMDPFAQHTNPYWITHARESEVLAVVGQFGALQEDIWETASPGNALVAAYREMRPAFRNALLVDIGSSGTVVAVVHEGQGVFVTSFPVGGFLFSEKVRAERGCSSMDAELAKNTENLLSGSKPLPALCGLVDQWHAELVRIGEDWLREHPSVTVSSSQFEVVLSGGGAEMPGLREYLRANSVMSFCGWADLPGVPPIQPAGQFAVAYGLACGLLRRGGPSASLVPEEMRAARKEQAAVQMLQASVWLLLAITLLVLGIGTWQKQRLIGETDSRLAQADSVIERARRTSLLKQRLAEEYDEVRPLLARQRKTMAAIQTLDLLTSRPLPTNAWFVLFADADSYYSEPAHPAATNSPPMTGSARLTNAFIAEFSTSEDAPTARAALSGMIDGFKQAGIFSKVDIVSDDQRRKLVNPAVVVPQGYYTLAFTLEDDDVLPSLLTGDDLRRLPAQPAPVRPAYAPFRKATNP